jgi:hypothetical protein
MWLNHKFCAMIAWHLNFQFQILVLLKGIKELGVVHYIVDAPMANLKFQNLAKIALWQLFMDMVICFHPYNNEMDQLVEANHQWVEEDSTTCIDAKMMMSDEEEKSMMLKPWNPKKKHDKWRRRKHRIGNIKDKNRFQWLE